MSTMQERPNPEIESMRHAARMSDSVVQLNTDGVTQSESLTQPPSGNCMNWVVGHLVAIYSHTLKLLGQQQVVSDAIVKRYDRGSPPIRDAADATDFGEIMNAWRESARRVDAGLAGLSHDVLDRPAPFSPNNDPNETMRSLITTLLFHQAYHAGQTGVLRRIIGKPGAIA